MRALTVACLMALGVALSPQAPAGVLPGVDVDLTTEYRYQWAQRHGGEDETDQDMRVGVGLEVPRAGFDQLSFSGLLHYEKDLDGTSEPSIYKDTLDSYSNRDDWRLYRAALTYRLPEPGIEITAGRQEVWSAETVTLDGAVVRVAPCRWASFDVYGGQRVSFYKDPDPTAVYGADLDLRLWQGGLIQLQDLYYIENSFEAAVVQQLWGWGSGRAAFRMIGSDAHDAVLNLHLYPLADTEVHVSYRRLYEDFDYDYTSDDDDTVKNLYLEELEPFSDYAITVRQGLFGVAGVGGRLRRHNVVDESDEDTYNTDFNEGAIILDLSEWPWKGLRFDGELLRWVEDRNRDDITEDDLWGFVVRAQQSFRGHAVGGSYYRRSYDSVGAARDSEGYDFWARLKVLDLADLHVRYEREEDDLYKEDGIDSLNVFSARLDLAF